jgi:hypothetical protein
MCPTPCELGAVGRNKIRHGFGLGITPDQAKILGLLLSRNVATAEAIHVALYGGRPWPATIPLLSSTSIGFVNPKRWIAVAICAICFSECVRGFEWRGLSALRLRHVVR